ncbi:MAG: type II secretion system F family protein [Lachnospiraceae bacterium]|nr:type II secretion system F family protein [Lachnospiraceae bacterium]MBR3824646.1 type II secretion system F family protein [Lachnospiraceae bacterium]MBR6664357.1 type II secretion system F family protein [Lachnospiraceae bacterium]
MGIYETVTGWFLGLDGQILRGMLLAVMLTAGGLLAVVFYRLWKKGIRLKEEKAGQKIYENMEEAFREKGGGTYEKLAAWLKGIGAEFFVKGFGDPFYFLAVNLGIFLGSMMLLGILGSSLAYGLLMGSVILLLELIFMAAKDKEDNQKMLEDIAFLYDGTAIQLSGNIYIAHAVDNCIPYMESKRLKQALTELSNNLMLGGDVAGATQDFKEKFNNTYLDTFCNVIVQITSQTGEAGSLIEDMSKQLTALQETAFMQKKKATENKLQICIIGIFLVFTALIFYLSIASMSGSTGILF